MVVDHVEQHREAGVVRGVDEPRETGGPSVRRMRRRRVHAVVPPAAVPGEGRDRHDLDRGHAEVAQLGQVRDRGGEGSFVGERADVELVDHQVRDRHAGPFLVGPLEGGVIDDLRPAADTVGLRKRARVGQRRTVVEGVRVARTRAGGDRDRVQPVGFGLQRVLLVVERERHGLRVRCPHPELDRAVADGARTQERPGTLVLGAIGHVSGTNQTTDSGGSTRVVDHG